MPGASLAVLPLALAALLLALVLREIGQRRQQAAVARAEGFFHEMLDDLFERLCRYRRDDHVILYCNEAWAAGHGASPEQLIGQRLDDLLCNEELEGLRSQLGRLGPDRPVLEDPEARPAPEDPTRAIWWVDTLLDGPGGEQVLATGRDVTQRMEADAALRASEERHRRLVDLLPVPAYVRSGDGTILVANPAFASHLGFPGPPAVVGRNIIEFSHPDDSGVFAGCLEPGDERGYEIRQVRSDGEIRTVGIRVVGTTWEGEPAVLGVVIDVTEIRAAQAALAASEARYRLFAEATGDGLSVVSLDGDVLEANPRFYESLGLDPAAPGPVHVRDYDLSLRGADVHAVLGAVRSPQVMESTYRRADGSSFPAEIDLRPTELGGEAVLFCTVHDLTARVAAEARVASSERQLNAVMDTVDEGIVLVDGQGRIVLANESAGHLLAEGRAAVLVGRPGHDLLAGAEVVLPERAPAGATDPVRWALRTGETLRGIEVGLRRDDGRRWLRVSASPLLANGDDVAAGVVLSLSDVTAEHDARVALAESERRHRSVVEGLSEGLIVVDADGRTLQANEAACRMLGLTLDQLLGRVPTDPGWEQLDGEGRPVEARRRTWAGLLAGGPGSSHPMGVRLPDGDVRWITVHAQVLDGSGGVEATVVLLSDVTGRRAAEQALAASEAKYRLLTENASDLVLLVTADGRLGYVSPSSEEQLGRPAGELVGTDWSDHVHPGDRGHLRALVIATPDGERGSGEVRLQRGDGDYHWFEAVWRVTVRREGREIYTVARDVQARKDAEADLFHRASHDELTGLANRRLLEQHLAAVLALPPGPHGAVLYVDLDRFKPVNDDLGHDAGDALLVAVAGRLRSTVRPGDTVARIGGDEFVVLAPTLQSPGDGRSLGCRLEAELGRPFVLEAGLVTIGASVGVVALEGQVDPAEVLAQADACMYARKRVRRAVLTGRPWPTGQPAGRHQRFSGS